MLKEKPHEFARELNLESFHASDGWLEKWKKRYTYLLLIMYFYCVYNSVQSFSFKALIYFSSAKNNNRQGTFIPRPSSAFMAFPSTLITHVFHLLLKNKILSLQICHTFPVEDVQLYSHHFF